MTICLQQRLLSSDTCFQGRPNLERLELLKLISSYPLTVNLAIATKVKDLDSVAAPGSCLVKLSLWKAQKLIKVTSGLGYNETIDCIFLLYKSRTVRNCSC